jgi:cell division protein ZapE
MTVIAERYEALVREGSIERDPAQVAAVVRLDGLLDVLVNQKPDKGRSLLGRLFGGGAPDEPTKGLYIWGEVGRGKTMLMDLFFGAVPLPFKRRVHFHAFMAEVHERVHDFRQRLKRAGVAGDDPIAPVAADIARETRLLCFDEFAVTDIADAMILGRLFTQLFGQGVVMIATSNVAPDRLYEGGLQRANFLPFLKLLGERVDVIHLAARTDFRLEKLEAVEVWHAPLDAAADAAMDAAWVRVSGGHDHGETLKVKGRDVAVPRAAMGAARFAFADLCGRPLGASDYLALARRFHTLVIDRIPVMTAAQRNEARRFITLIDALYDHGCKLVASAAAAPHALYTAEDGKEAFEFRRCASRLIEMRSHDYLAAPHVLAGEGSFIAVET